LTRIALFAVIVWLGLPAAAVAQQLVPPPEVPTTLRPGWTLTPSLTVAPVWDSNVALTSEAQGALGDSLVTVGSGLESRYRGRRGQFTLEYRGSYDFYRRFTEFNAPDHRGRVEFQRGIGRSVSLFARNIYGMSPTTNISLPDVGLITLRRRTTSSNDFRGGMDIRRGEHTLFTMAYSSQWVDLVADEEVQPLLRSGHAHRGDLILRRELSRRLTLGAQYDFQHAIVADGEETFDIQHASGTLEVALSPTLQVLGSAGYAWQLAGRGQEAQQAPAVMAELRYQANRTFWTFGYARTYLASFGFGGTVQNEDLRATLQVPIGRRFDLGGLVSARENDPLTGGPGLRVLSAQGTAGFAVASWLRFEAFATSSWQDARRAGGKISRTRAGVRLVTLYPMRLD
jgi:hypothetical protein